MESSPTRSSSRQVRPAPDGWRDAVVAAMMATAVFDFGGGFGLRYATTALGLVYIITRYRDFDVRINEFLPVLVLFFIMPLWSVVNGLMDGGNLAIAQSQVTPFVSALLFFFLLFHGGSRRAIDIFYQSLYALACVTCFLVLYGLLLPSTLLIETVIAILKTDANIHGLFGERNVAGITIYSIYFKATLFYVGGFVYSLYRGKVGRAAVFFLALVLVVSKSGIALCAVFALWYGLVVGNWKQRTALILGSAVSVGLVLSFVDVSVINGYVDYLSATFRGEATTSKIRIGHWRSFLDLMREHPSYLIWGQGTGTKFVSLGEVYRSGGIAQAVYNIELDHVDSIRQFGLLWFLGFAGLAGWVSMSLIARRSDQEGRALGYAMIALFVAAGTNPVLITPLFMLALIAHYHYARGRL